VIRLQTAGDCLREIKALRDQYQRSVWDAAMKQLKRERLENYGRDPRKKFPPRMYQRLFDMQRGVCRFCNNHLDVPAKKNEIDHIDPSRQDFNTPSNLELLHVACNRVKSSRTLYEQSKLTGKPLTEILKPEESEP
jgi:CRISPR/Cas system Type II protein with McrA/HNH and RuvC-like nuclease domain